MSPVAPLRRCSQVGCRTLVPRGRCSEHASVPEAPRPNRDVRRWYGTARWQRLRLVVLREEPLCRSCAAAQHVVQATDVDHVQPHQGKPERFWNRRNLQPLCASCHARKTRSGQ